MSFFERFLEFVSKISPIHPNMTSNSSNDWSLTYSATYPSRVVSGALWYLFSSSVHNCEIYVDNGSWLVTLTAPSNGVYFFTGFSKMVFLNGDGYYRNGTGCTVKTYKNGVQTSSNTYVYRSGLDLSASPKEFDTIKLSGFYGGYQADDLCHDVGKAYLNGYVLR